MHPCAPANDPLCPSPTTPTLRERAKKSIELDVCLSVWELVLSGPEFPLLKDFSEFLKGANVPVVTKDMWAQTLAFFCQVEADLSNFDESGERVERDPTTVTRFAGGQYCQ